MPRFSIVPADQTQSVGQIVAADASAALCMADRMQCDAADILQDGEYLFSVYVSGPEGLWTIFQREDFPASLIASRPAQRTSRHSERPPSLANRGAPYHRNRADTP